MAVVAVLFDKFRSPNEETFDAVVIWTLTTCSTVQGAHDHEMRRVSMLVVRQPC